MTTLENTTPELIRFEESVFKKINYMLENEKKRLLILSNPELNMSAHRLDYLNAKMNMEEKQMIKKEKIHELKLIEVQNDKMKFEETVNAYLNAPTPATVQSMHVIPVAEGSGILYVAMLLLEVENNERVVLNKQEGINHKIAKESRSHRVPRKQVFE